MNASSARPDCSVAPVDDLMVCDRCGLEWFAGADKPPCNPITFDMLRARMLREVNQAEIGLGAVRLMARDGQPGDPAAARRRFAEMEKIRLLVERCTSDPAILALIRPKKTQPAGRAGKP